MVTEVLQAWILHKKPVGDTSTFIHFFTRDLGIVRCLYRGGRLPKKQAMVQPFIPLWLIMDIRKDSYYVRQLESLSMPLELESRYLFAALYLNEILYYALPPMEACPELFELYQNSLQALSTLENLLAIELLLRRFEWELLRVCGYSISLMQEADSGKAIEKDRRYQFIAGKGLFAAEQGMAGFDILAFAAGEFSEPGVLKTAKLIMRKAIDHLLAGQKIQARSLFTKS